MQVDFERSALEQLSLWRQALVLLLLRVTVWTAAIPIAVSTYWLYSRGDWVGMAAGVGFYLGAFAALFLPIRDVPARTTMVIWVLYLSGVGFMISDVPHGVGLAHMLMTAILAGLLLNRRAAFLWTLATFVAIFAVTGAYTLGLIHAPYTSRVGWEWWVITVFAAVGMALMAFLPQQYILNRLVQSLETNRRDRDELDRIFSLSLDMLCVADTDGRYIKVNPVWQEVLGYSPSELQGQPFLDLVHPDDIQASRQATAELASGKDVFDFVNRCRHKDGSYRWIEWRSRPAAPNLIYAAARDITERRQSQLAIQQSEARFRAIFESARDAFLLMRDGRFIACNAATLEMFRCRREDLIGKGPADIAPPRQPDGSDSVVAALRHDEHCQSTGSDLFEWRGRRLDGTEFDIEVSLAALVLDEQPTILISIRDITERKQAQLAVERSETKFRAIFESARDALFLMRDGRYIECNTATLEMFRCPIEDLLGKGPLDLSPPRQPDGRDTAVAAREHIERCLNTGSDFFEWRGRRADGTEFDSEVGLTKLVLDGQPTILIFARDITDRKRAQKDLERSETKFRAIFESARDAFLLMRDGRYIECNAAPLEMLGCRREDLIGKGGADTAPPRQPDGRDSAEAAREHEQRCLATGSDFFQWRSRRFDGTEFDTEISLTSLVLDGQPTILVSARNITERKQAQMALERSETKFRTLFDSARDAFILMRDSRYMECNAATLRLFRCSMEELIGKTPAELSPLRQPDGRYSADAALEHDTRCLTTGSDLFEWRSRRPDGTEFDDEVSLTSLVLDGQPTILISLRDITERKQSERALRDSEARLRSIFLASPLGIGVSRDRVMLEGNDRFSLMTGYSRDELTGHNTRMLYPTDRDYDESGRDLYDQIRQKGFGSVESRWRRKDGQVIDVFISASPIDPNDPSAGITTIVQDITERKQARIALERSEVQYRAIFDSARDALFLQKGDRFIECNAAMCELYRCRREDVIGHTPAEFSPPRQPDGRDSAESALEHIRRCETTGSDFFEWRSRRLDGTEFDAEITLSRLFLDGQPHIYAAVRDVTARRQTERDIRDSEARLSSIFLAAPLGISTVDQGRNILQVSDRFCQTFGYTRQELIGQNARMLYATQEEYDTAGRVVYQQIRERGFGTMESRGRRKDGTIIDTLLSASPIDPDNPSAGVTIIVQDITEQKKAQIAVQQSEAHLRSVFLAAPLGIATYRDRVALEVSDRFSLIAGFPREELVGRNSRMLYPTDDDYDYVGHNLYDQLREKGFGSVESRWKRKDGRVIDVLINASPINPSDPFGDITIIVQDITERKKAQADLQQSEAYLRSVFLAAPLGISVADSNRTLIEVSDRFCQGFGYTREELVGQSARMLYLTDEEFEAAGRELYGQIARTGLGSAETRMHRKDGTIINVLLSGSVIDPNNPSAGTTIIVQDITERKKMEAETKAEELRLQALLRISQYQPAEIGELLDMALEEIVRLSASQYGYIFHYDEDTHLFTVHAWSQAVMRDCTVHAPPQIYRLENTGIWGEPVRRRKPLVVNDFTAANPLKKGHPQGHVNLFRFMTIPVFRGERIVAVVGVANKSDDYTDADVHRLSLMTDAVWNTIDRRRADDALRESEAKFAKAFHANPAAMTISSLDDDRLIDANEAFERITGFSRQEAIGRSPAGLNILIVPDDPRNLRLSTRALGSVRNVERRVRRKDGTILTGLFSAETIDLAGKPCMLSIMVDITERRLLLEQLQEINAQLEQRVRERTAVAEKRSAQLRELAARLTTAEHRERKCIAHILHEHFQQLLASAKFTISALRWKMSDIPLRPMLDEIDSMIDQAIQASRSLSVELCPPILYDLGLAASLEWLGRWTHDRYGLRVTVHADPAANPQAEDVAILLFHAVRELLFNTVKHANASHSTVTMSALDSAQTRILVADDGIGFDPSLPPSGRDLTGGFGLSNIRERIELVGGAMEIDSSPGHGTRITLLAPISRATPPVSPE